MVLGGDYYLERSSKAAPDLKTVGAGAGATLASVALINTGIGALATVGLIMGVLSSGAMVAYHGKRTLDASECKCLAASRTGTPDVVPMCVGDQHMHGAMPHVVSIMACIRIRCTACR